MSTRAMIGQITTLGRYEARYLHSDGYPAHTLVRLHQVWQRHDRSIELMLANLLKRDWSGLDPDGGHRDEARGGSSNWVWVDGIGRSYPDGEMSPYPMGGHLRSERREDYDWAYLWNPRSRNLCVYGRHDQRWQLAAVITEWEFGRLTAADAQQVQDEFRNVVCSRREVARWASDF